MGDLPVWLDDDRRRRNTRSGAQERARAAEIGGRVQAGSGSSWRAPQDVHNATHMEQIKFTDQKSYSLTAKELRQLLEDALRAGKDPRMVIDFQKYGIRAIIEVETL